MAQEKNIDPSQRVQSIPEQNLVIEVPSAIAMEELGKRLASWVQPGLICYLQGELGAGKTTLVRGFLRGLGHLDRVPSPTFSLYEYYQIGEIAVCHFDLYRLQLSAELVYLGVADYWDGRTICLIEWPEHGQGFLPQADLECQLSWQSAEVRRLNLKGMTARGVEIVQNFRLIGDATEA